MLKHLKNMIERGGHVLLRTENLDRRSFLALDEDLRDGLVLKIQQMGESATRISSPETEKYPHIDWSGIINTRNKIAHCEEINYEKIWDIIEKDLPVMLPQLQNMFLEEMKKQ